MGKPFLLSPETFKAIAKNLIKIDCSELRPYINMVWYSNTLQHHKGIFVICGSDKLYQVTFDGDTGAFHLDTYKQESKEVYNP